MDYNGSVMFSTELPSYYPSLQGIQIIVFFQTNYGNVHLWNGKSVTYNLNEQFMLGKSYSS